MNLNNGELDSIVEEGISKSSQTVKGNGMFTTSLKLSNSWVDSHESSMISALSSKSLGGKVSRVPPLNLKKVEEISNCSE